ncbi:MAG: diacylglycerol kinase family lipid kinase [Bacteroidetes bacterium]|nr:MAG: diacylglycerol kinase family lipid kinase [Bacteroidota bacterium]
MKKIFFIINPVSGVGKQKIVEKNIDKYLDKKKFAYEIKYTEKAKHAIKISSEAAGKFDIVTAVGGDGSVNEVCKGLINSSSALAIIPTGSGNGLARYLNIPLKIDKAIKLINQTYIKKIDTAEINNEKFVNVAGIGFDAHVSHIFANYGKRGPLPYVKIAAEEFPNYRAQKYRILIDDKLIYRKAFLISFANSSQFGNNAYISPEAKIDDGLIDVCIFKNFPIVESPRLAVMLFDKRLDKSKYMEIIKGKEITITHENSIIAHIDGEPVSFGKEIKVKINPQSLNVIASNKGFNQDPFYLKRIKKILK